MEATRWLREAVAEALSLIMVLQRAVVLGGFDPYALRRAIEAGILRVKLDDRARALGFTAEYMRRVRLALFATADEVTQRPGSLADYSTPPPPAEPPLLQQRHFGGTIAGHTFFKELDATLDNRRPDDAESAVLEVFALCLALGFRGKYEAHDIAGYEAVRARVNDKLRRGLAVPDELPRHPAARWPPTPRHSRLLLWIGLLCAVFGAAMFLTYRRDLGRDAATLHDQLSAGSARHT